MNVRSISTCLFAVISLAFVDSVPISDQAGNSRDDESATLQIAGRDEPTGLPPVLVDDTLPTNLDFETIPLGFSALSEIPDDSQATLTEVVQFYQRGGAPADPGIDKDLAPLNLSDQEIEYLVEFLKALSQ